MVRRWRVQGILLLVLVAPAALATSPDPAEGVRAAEAWLKLIDDGQYGASWDASAAMFKAAVTRVEWVRQAGAVRVPLGKVLSRKLVSSQLAHALPGAPDGTYVVVVYQTRFEHKEQARETVTVALDPGERFRGTGYFIR